jgi:hypothetical protein
MLANQSELLCPFNKFKKCNPKCALYRRGVRFSELTNEAIPVEMCVFNIIGDNSEATHNRISMLQKEMGQTKDAVIMGTLVDMQLVKQERAQAEILKIANPNIIEMQEPTKLIE